MSPSKIRWALDDNESLEEDNYSEIDEEGAYELAQKMGSAYISKIFQTHKY